MSVYQFSDYASSVSIAVGTFLYGNIFEMTDC